MRNDIENNFKRKYKNKNFIKSLDKINVHHVKTARIYIRQKLQKC